MSQQSPDIRSQSKGVIYKVYTFLKQLKDVDDIKSVLSATQEATARACGVSLRSVQRVCEQYRKRMNSETPGPSFSSPKKKIEHKKPVTDVDDFQKDLIRRKIQEFYDNGMYPTREKVMEAINFRGSKTSMSKILRSLGYQYKRSNDGRRFLMERNDIIASRISFLRKMHSIRNELSRRPIIYIDETWVNQNHSRKYIWQDSMSSGGLKMPLGKGLRLIVCHAGSSNYGFIEGAKLVFKTGNNGDYHHQMNNEVFKEWFLDLLRGLEESCVLVMDNASYHSCVTEKIPTTNSKKQDIVSWLTSKQIPHDPRRTIPELRQIVDQYKGLFPKVYELDKIAAEMGHEVVRLPPYHCHYNPIELIWAQVKGEVADRNKTFKINDVRVLLEEALDNVTIEDWKKCVAHSERLQEEDFMKEIGRDESIERLVINLESDSSEVDSDSGDEF